MIIIRKFLLVSIVPLLVVLLCVLSLDFGILRIIGNAGPIEHSLADSGIYNNVVSSALDQAQKSSGSSNEIALNNQTIKSAAESTFTPQLIQQSTQQAINSVYDWLNGKTAQPDFRIDLTSVKSNFALRVGQAALQRAATLPVCNITNLPSPSADPLNVTCLPTGITAVQISEQAVSDVLNAQGFLDHPIITADSIKISGSSQSVFAGKLQNAPKLYRLSKKTPAILIILTLLVVAMVILLSSSYRKGLRYVGVIFLFSGLTIILFSLGINNVVNHKAIPKIQLSNKVLQSDVQQLAGDLSHTINQNFQLFGEIYAALGVLTIGCTIILRSNKKSPLPLSPNSANAIVGQTENVRPVYKTPPGQYRKTPPKIQG